jgi:hypothetical protein
VGACFLVGVGEASLFFPDITTLLLDLGVVVFTFFLSEKVFFTVLLGVLRRVFFLGVLGANGV